MINTSNASAKPSQSAICPWPVYPDLESYLDKNVGVRAGQIATDVQQLLHHHPVPSNEQLAKDLADCKKYLHQLIHEIQPNLTNSQKAEFGKKITADITTFERSQQAIEAYFNPNQSAASATPKNNMSSVVGGKSVI